MFLRLFFTIAVVAWSGVSFSQQVVFQTGKVYALFNFAQTISGNPHRSQTLKDYFDQSKFNDAPTKAAISEFAEVAKVFRKSWEFDEYPAKRFMDQSLGSIFLIQATYSKDLKDLSQRTEGLLPLSLHKRLFNALAIIEPIYDELVWNPSTKGLLEYETKVKELARRVNVNAMYDKTKAFYGAEWPSETPFVVSLYPIPGTKGEAPGESTETVESVAVLVGRPADPGKVADVFGVAFHEMSHSIFRAQPAEFQNKIDKYFKNSTSKFAGLAYRYANEAVATVVGNVWAFKKATGKMLEGKWYGHPIIDAYAKEIYPVIEPYIESGKRMDQALIDRMIVSFERRLGDTLLDYTSIFDEIKLLSDKVHMTNFRPAAQKYFRIREIGRSSLDGYQGGDSSAPLVVLFLEKDYEQVEKLSHQFKAISPHLKVLKEERKVIVSLVDENQRPFILIKLNSSADINLALEKLSSEGKIKPDSPVIRY
ncbi:MAG: hypothetical protein AB7T49_09125 [Oligoflexales bacterium]